MRTRYPPLSRHSVEVDIAETEEAEGGAEGGFAEKGFVEGLVEGRVLEPVAEEGINKNECLEKRGGKVGPEGGIIPNFVVGVDEAVAEAVVTEEDAAENGEGAAEGGGDNGGDNPQGKAQAEGEEDAEGDEEDADSDEADVLCGYSHRYLSMGQTRSHTW